MVNTKPRSPARLLLSDAELMGKNQSLTAILSPGNRDAQGHGAGILYYPSLQTGEHNPQILMIANSDVTITTSAVTVTLELHGSNDNVSFETAVIRKAVLPVGRVKADHDILRIGLPQDWPYKYVKGLVSVDSGSNISGTVDFGVAVS